MKKVISIALVIVLAISVFALAGCGDKTDAGNGDAPAATLKFGMGVVANLGEAKAADGSYAEVASGTTIGYQKIARFEAVSTDEIRIRITDSRVCPVLSFIGVY